MRTKPYPSAVLSRSPILVLNFNLLDFESLKGAMMVRQYDSCKKKWQGKSRSRHLLEFKVGISIVVDDH